MATKTIGGNHKVVVGKDGKTRVVLDTKRIEAKKPVSARGAPPKQKFKAVSRKQS